MTTTLHFLVRFVAASSLGMGLWLGWGVEYVDWVAPAVNAMAAWTGQPFELVRHQDHVLYAYRGAGQTFRLLATGQESIWLNLVAMGAVFAATPGRTASWRLARGGVALGLLWTTHVVSFYLGGSVALWQFAATTGEAAVMAEALAPWIPAARADWSLKVLEAWNLWGRYGLCIVLWIGLRSRPYEAPAPRALALPWRRWLPRATPA